MATVSANKLELLQVADTVARDKGIDRDEVLGAMEQAIQKAGRSKYGRNTTSAPRSTARAARCMLFREVAEPVENEATQITLDDARRLNPEAEVGDFITDPLPPIDFGRIAAQTAKQVIVQKVREAERQRQFDEFKDRVGEIVNGLVKRVEFGNVMVDLGRAEAIAAPRRTDAARKLPPGRPRARLHLRRARGSARAADLPVAHPSAIHGQAVRAGSAGNLRRHHRDQGGGARSRQPRQDRGDLERQRHRPGRRLRRHARLRVQAVVANCRARRSTSFPGRPTRHLRRQRAGAGRGHQGGDGRGAAGGSKWWCRTSSSRWPSAGAARTCGSPRS